MSQSGFWTPVEPTGLPKPELKPRPTIASSFSLKEQSKLRIESRAPTRIDLAGGTLDIWPLYLFHPGALTVNCAVTRHASCVLETTNDSRIQLVSVDSRKRESFASLKALRSAKEYK